MTQALTRRRFLTISAGLAAAAAALPARAAGTDLPLTEWRGIALGAQARILIAHPDAPALTALAAAEIARLEAVFSLYRADSALAQLNAAGRLQAPPFELLECLALAGRIHAATGGLFDPTVQPLWDLYARSWSAGAAPEAGAIAAAQALTGWSGVTFDEAGIALRPGMALTLNGIAQGFIADKVAALLRGRGLDHVLVDAGEFHAIGPMPDGAAWPVALTAGGRVDMTSGGLASSSALGTTFDPAGRVGHILDPRSGLPAPPRWQLVTITAAAAALADGLSTAACLMDSADQIAAAVAAFPGASLAHLA